MKYILLSVTIFFVATAMLLTSNCTPSLDPPKPQPGSCDFSRTVAVGGDFMSGYADGALSNDGMSKCIPALLSRQFALADQTTYYGWNYTGADALGWNLKPWENWFSNPAHLGYNTDCLGVTSLMPLSDSMNRTIANGVITAPRLFGIPTNQSVPFARITDLFDPALGNYTPGQNTNPFYRPFAANPGVTSPMFSAQNWNATFFTAWLGMEDIFDYAQLGGAGTSITSTSTFSTYLDSALMRLTANGAKGVIANIPDFRSFPFYTLVPWNGADLQQSTADSLTDIYLTGGMPHINFHAGANGFVIADANAPMGFRQLHAGEYILLDVPLDSMKCDFYGVLVHEINDRYILDSTEVANIDAAIATYNSIIAQKAAQYDLALVDANAYFNHIVSGIKWDGVDYNAEFVSGGFFSLDGYHPNQKGYALLANEFIKAINAKYGATIPTLNCFDCNGILFP